MQDTVFMRVMSRARHFRDEFHRVPDRHRRAPDYFVQLAAFDEFHTEVARAITLADFVDRNDTRMLQTRCGFSFKAKALQVRFARPLPKADDL